LNTNFACWYFGGFRSAAVIAVAVATAITGSSLALARFWFGLGFFVFGGVGRGFIKVVTIAVIDIHDDICWSLLIVVIVTLVVIVFDPFLSFLTAFAD
jgi:hypothetical protein